MKRFITTDTQNQVQDLVEDNTGHSSKSCQVSSILSNNSPRKRKLRLINKCLRNKIQHFKKFYVLKSEIPKLLDEDVMDICKLRYGVIGENFSEQVKLLKAKSPKGNRFSLATKKFALKIYYQSPMAYRSLMKKTILPSRNTLQRMVQHIPRNPGFHEFTFQKIKEMASSLSETDKCCTVLLDEMSVQRNLFYDSKKDYIIGFHDTGTTRKKLIANNALVIMVRGISTYWKQPLGKFLYHAIQ